MSNNQIISRLLLVLAFVLAGVTTRAELTPEQVVTKAAAVISNARSLSVGFSVNSGGQSVKGTIKSAGNKFTVETPQVSSWYNGKELYTYNSRTKETTLTNPTAQELLESNPLLYVKTGAANFKCSFARTMTSGKYVVDLVPKSDRSGIKKLTFTIDRKTFQIEKIVMNASGTTSVVSVTSFASGSNYPASTFVYPKTRYKGVEIVDLR